MRTNYQRLAFSGLEPAEIDMLIALLGEFPFEGFEEASDGRLLAWIAGEKLDENELRPALNYFPNCRYELTEVASQNWNREWEQDFKPVLIDDFAAIRAQFHPPQTGVKHELVITPKMSFGTGHHATTEMMFRLMEPIDFKNKSVLDFGTGTGVLAILAERMGAAQVLAIDLDEWSLANARENAEINRCKKIRIESADRVSGQSAFDIILANINLNVLTLQMAELKEAVRPGGTLLLSGFLEGDREAMENALERNNLRLEKSVSKSGWLAIKACN